MSYSTEQAIQDLMYASGPCEERELIAYCVENCTDDVVTCFPAAMTNLIEMGAIYWDAEFDCYDIGEN